MPCLVVLLFLCMYAIAATPVNNAPSSAQLIVVNSTFHKNVSTTQNISCGKPNTQFRTDF